MRSRPSSHLIRIAALCLLGLAATASPAQATSFYVAFDSLSETCRIMVTKPDGETMRPLGRAHATYDEAETAMRRMDECAAQL